MTTRLRLAPYLEQRARWPATGRHILAQAEGGSVVVYQAYSPGIGQYTAAHGRFGCGWSYERMSWVKPNFLWMMYRCGWATKPGQEVVLALWIPRAGFDAILADAVASSHDPRVHPDKSAWQRAVAGSDVRLQWDPDHAPGGAPEQRRAIQLGLRGETLRRFADEWLLHVEDITPLVAAQRPHARSPFTELLTPDEHVYSPADAATARRLGLAP
jgi:hypothetical protein